MPSAYSALPHGPSSPSTAGVGARRAGGRGLIGALVHTHRRTLVLVALLVLLFVAGAALNPPVPADGSGSKGRLVALREGWRPWSALGGSGAAQHPTSDAGSSSGAPQRGKTADEQGDISFGSPDFVDSLAAEGEVDALPETDAVDDEAGLGAGAAARKGKSPRPFGKAGAGHAALPPADDDDLAAEDYAPIDSSYGEDYLTSPPDDDDEAAGSAPHRHGAAADVDNSDLLADSPGGAAQEDAAARAPIAAVAPVHHAAAAVGASGEDRPGSGTGTGAGAGEAGHAAAKAGFAHPVPPPQPPSAPPAAGAAAADAAAADAAQEGGAARPKIGTGGRLGSGAVAELKPANRVGAGAKAGAVVKDEAGRRVGTGARPGAKGMGTRRRRRRV